MSERQDMRTIERLALVVAELRLLVNKAGRSNDMQRTAIDSGPGLEVVDPATGETAWRVGANADGVVSAQVLTGPDPVQPSAPTLTAGLASLEVRWDGLDAFGDPAAADAAEVRVYATTEEVLEPVAGNHVGKIDGKGGAATLLAMPGTWTVRIEIVTLSGKVSAPSAPVTIEIAPLVGEASIREALENAQLVLGEAHNEAMDLLDQLEVRADEGSEALAEAVRRLADAEAILAPLPVDLEEAKQYAKEAADAALAAEARATEANNRAMTRLANGNFEDGVKYWDTSYGLGLGLTADSHSGGQAAWFGVDRQVTPESLLPVVEAQIWELQFYYKARTDSAAGSPFYAAFYDQNGSLIDAGGWNTRADASMADWRGSGGIRLTVPAGVDQLRFTIGHAEAAPLDAEWVVDDVVLRDVTDVVRLEIAAQEAKQAGTDAQSDAAALRLLVEGAGGIQDRLDEALTGPVDHDRLRVGTGAFDEVFADEVIAGIIGAKKAVVIELIAQDLIADNATLISAAMKTLSVSEKASFADAYAEQFWAEMAVINRLTAETAWITDAMISSLSSEKLTVTQELWARLAQFAVVEAGMIRGDAFEGQTFTGGRFVGASFESLAAAMRGVKMDTQGLRSYDSTGTKTFELDATTGDVTMEGGTLRGADIIGSNVVGGYVGTGSTGRRVYLEGDRLTAKDESDTTTAELAPGGLKLTKPGEGLVEIGPHIYGGYYRDFPEFTVINDTWTGSTSYSAEHRVLDDQQVFDAAVSRRWRVDFSFQYQVEPIWTQATATLRVAMRVVPEGGGAASNLVLRHIWLTGHTDRASNSFCTFGLGSLPSGMTRFNIQRAVAIRSTSQVRITDFNYMITPA